MPTTSFATSAARAGAAAFAILAGSSTAALASPPVSSETTEAARVFCGYVEARNRHDFRQASALVSNDVRWLDTEGRNHPKNDARLEPMIAWEGGMGGKWTCRVLGYADGWLEAEVSEQNRMYDALDVGAIFQRDRVRVEGGKIREGRTLAEWSTGRDEDDAFGEFKKWLATLPGERRAGLLRDGSLVYDAETARREQVLLDEWQKAHRPARRVGANPHTKENLFAWLPDERLLFQGGLFYYEEGAPFPPSGRETMNRFFAAWLAAHDLSAKAIYGVHYTGAAPPEALDLAAR